MSLNLFRRHDVRALAWLVAVLAWSSACSGPASPSAKETTRKTRSADSTTVVTIDWWMPEMFGNTFDANGIPNLVPTAVPPGTWGNPIVGSPMNPTAWNVMLNGCQATAAQSYVWDIGLPTGNLHLNSGSSCIQWVGFPAQGTYSVTLTMNFADGTSAAGSQLVTVKNYLIVTMGDSLASGEGDADLQPTNGASAVAWSNQRCHRSANSGHAQAAMNLEFNDLHSSVRYIDVACSGAGIVTGLLNGYVGEEVPSPPQPNLPSQIAQVAQLTCPAGAKGASCTPIDALVMTVGANDAGFGIVARACANPTSSCSTVPSFTSAITADVASLGGSKGLYAQLNTAIAANLNVKRIYLTEYHDPTHDQNGQLCQQMVYQGAGTDQLGYLVTTTGSYLGFSLADGVVDAADVKWAHDNVLVPMNANGASSAAMLGWKYIGGIASSFHTRGYCSASPWIETYSQSKADQGNPDGTMHPNQFGYDMMGQYIYQSLAEDLNQPTSVVSSVPFANEPINVVGRGTNSETFAQSYAPAPDAWQPSWSELYVNQEVWSTQPVAVAAGPGQAAAFAVDQTGTVWGIPFTTFLGWGAWSPLQGMTAIYNPTTKSFEQVSVQGKLAATARADGSIDLLARGGDGLMWHEHINWVDANGFSAQLWEPTESPPYIGTPSIVAGGPNDLDVAAIGADPGNANVAALWHGWENNGTWSWEEKTGVWLSGNPSLISWGPTRLDFFATGQWDGQLWHLAYDSGWGSWEPLGNTLTSDPVATTWGSGWMTVAARGPDEGVWTLTYEDGWWDPWWQTGFPSESGITVDSVKPGNFDFYAQWPGGGVYSGQMADWDFLQTYWLGGVVF